MFEHAVGGGMGRKLVGRPFAAALAGLAFALLCLIAAPSAQADDRDLKIRFGGDGIVIKIDDDDHYRHKHKYHHSHKHGRWGDCPYDCPDRCNSWAGGRYWNGYAWVWPSNPGRGHYKHGNYYAPPQPYYNQSVSCHWVREPRWRDGHRAILVFQVCDHPRRGRYVVQDSYRWERDYGHNW